MKKKKVIVVFITLFLAHFCLTLLSSFCGCVCLCVCARARVCVCVCVREVLARKLQPASKQNGHTNPDVASAVPREGQQSFPSAFINELVLERKI